MEKQFLLTGFLEYLLVKHFGSGKAQAKIITPSDPAQRGSQLSFEFNMDMNKVHKEIESRGIVVSVIRESYTISPVD